MSLTRRSVTVTLLLVTLHPVLTVDDHRCRAEERLGLVSPPIAVRDDVVPHRPATGRRLERVLDDAVPGATWKNAPLRRVVSQISEGYEVAILRDRRIDPTVPIDLSAVSLPLRDVLDEVARGAGGRVRRVGNVVYLVPDDPAATVRTLVELRRQELAGVPSRRAAILSQSRTIGWSDLTEPVEIVRKISDRFDIAVENPHDLPHDLWAGSVFPEMEASEMLTLVLIQFDLTFQWSNEANSIRLVPLPEETSTIGIERTYPSVQNLDEALAAWRASVGGWDGDGVDVVFQGDQNVVRGPLELHELIEQVRTGRRRPRSRSEGGARNGQMKSDGISEVPLARREFTLTVSRVPASAILRKLEESGIKFVYDDKELSEAGIDLNRPVSLDVERADAETFFRTVFDPLGLSVELDGVTVTLTPSPTSSPSPR